MWPQANGFAADVSEGAINWSVIVGARYFARGPTARLIGCECGKMVIGRPARELGPIDRLELAAGEFQRFFGRCGAGREA